MTIVVVDDDRFNLDLLEAVLEPLGEKVARFEDPLEALAAMEGLRPVLVITDHLMPGIQGVELVARLRAMPAVADTPVLMLTGADELAVRVAAFDVGVTDFATRPIDPTELLARARALSRLGAAQVKMKRQAMLLAGEVREATATLAVTQLEHERLNQQLRAAEHFEGIAELASGMAHDINNLLTVISGGAESLADMYPDDDAVAEETQAILEAVDRGASLTRQVLAYSRRQALRPAVFDAAREIERNRLMLIHAAGSATTLTLDLTSDATPVWVDQTQFLTALINLIANARDASGRDPRITLRVATVPRPPDEGPTAGPAPAVLVEIADNGSGMTSEVASRAFDPFFTTKPRGEGTGLGLSMVHGFVHQSGGTLRLLSTRGVGTRVRLFFPLATSIAAVEATEAPRPAPPRRTLTPRVLVVDDDDAVRRMLGRMLELRGLLVDTAPNAMTAIQRLRDQRFDAVLSDVLMPGDLDGLDLARWARQSGLPVLLVSGFVGGELPRDLLNDPGVRLVRKPADSALLAKELRDLVQAGELGRPA
jgi:signal transduction histidine kinase